VGVRRDGRLIRCLWLWADATCADFKRVYIEELRREAERLIQGKDPAGQKAA